MRRKIILLGLVALVTLAVTAVVEAWDVKRHLNGSAFDCTVYFTRDTNTSGGLDTNNSGMQYDTIWEHELMLDISGYDKGRYWYTLDAKGATDERCTLFNTFYWGNNDTNTQLITAVYVDTVTGIDSTYDSVFCISTTVLDSDSLMYLEWLAHRLVIGMHVWDDDDTNTAGRFNETSTAVHIRKSALYLDKD